MGESKEYMTLPEENGSINISEEVIAAIAVGAVRDVEGVSGMMTAMGGSVTDLVHNKKNAQKGAKGVKIGCFADTVEGGKKWRDLGVKFIGYGCDTYIFMQAAKADVATFAK